MPSKNILRNEISTLTNFFYSEEVILSKANYKQTEANQILLKCLVSYYSLPLIDEIMSKFLKANTTMSTAWVRDTMRNVWTMNYILRTKKEKKIITQVHLLMLGSSIGRNQLIELLLQCTKENIND